MPRYDVRPWDHTVSEWTPRKSHIREQRREWVIVDTAEDDRVIESADAKWPMDSAAECYNEGAADPPPAYRHTAVRYPSRLRLDSGWPERMRRTATNDPRRRRPKHA